MNLFLWSGELPVIHSLLDAALSARQEFFDLCHEAAFRIFNGFTEGCPALVVDLFARTLVIHNYADAPDTAAELMTEAKAFLLARLPWVQAVVLKIRHGQTESERNGTLVYGERPDRKIREHGVWYAIDLMMNRDSSFYADTRNLRAWARAHLEGKTVLNLFAYTGSLGIAAQAGGAARVVQLDLSRRFLNVAKESCTLNGFPIRKSDFIVGDFWPKISFLKRSGQLFDCVLLDPPFFSSTSKGTVQTQNETPRLINKVRPLVQDEGALVVVNNALFLSGAEYVHTLEQLCEDGYLAIERLIPVPADFAGYPETTVTPLPVDPAPFNHPTKIAVLRVRRKKKQG
ncbi:MAG TPA: class I SAM-dependent methyltransferase [Acidobacteriota bacterium]|nr:class I SAM-dependent methyltransferase [Acidobacteriota bacterium]